MYRSDMLIKELFLIKDKQRLIAYLESFDWDFAHYGPVILRIGHLDVICRYTACGNQKNTPVIELKLEDSRYSNVDQVEKIYSKFKGSVHIVRKD